MSLKVFPATLTSEGHKVPLVKGWRELATNDPAQIKLWQELFRERLHFWGTPCGDINGFFTLDVDVKTKGFETLQKNNLQIPKTLSQKTMNGGQHYLFKFDPARETGNKVGFLPGLDIRSTGGWIVYYGMDFSVPIADAPDWIYHAAHKKSVTPATPESLIKLAPEIAQGIFQTSIDNVRNAPEGESNNVLNIESFKVGQLVASGSMSREFAFAELFKAAKERGKPDYESKATIESGLNGGLKHPLISPFGSEAPKPAFDIPAIPGTPERWTPRYLTRSDLLDSSKLRRPQLFRDWSTQDITITTADGGTGKTTLKLFEAICLALGERFLGFDCVQPGKTLFITGEDTEGKLAAMLGVIMKGMGILEDEAKVQTILSSIVIKKDADLCLIAKDKQGFLYPNPDAFRKIQEAVDDIKPKMVVFDPIASFWGSEAALNDMNKAVTKVMSALVEKNHCCVEMLNHMGKSSSANKDMSQFAGRGGSGLPSNSRVSRVLRGLSSEEFREMTDTDLVGDQTAILVRVNKFTDGSPLLDQPFIVVRDGFLFTRITLNQMKTREMEKSISDNEKIFAFIKQSRKEDKYPTKNVVVAHFMNSGDPLSEARIKRALDTLGWSGHSGEKIELIANPDTTRKEHVYIITDLEGKEKV